MYKKKWNTATWNSSASSEWTGDCTMYTSLYYMPSQDQEPGCQVSRYSNQFLSLPPPSPHPLTSWRSSWPRVLTSQPGWVGGWAVEFSGMLDMLTPSSVDDPPHEKSKFLTYYFLCVLRHHDENAEKRLFFQFFFNNWLPAHLRWESQKQILMTIKFPSNFMHNTFKNYEQILRHKVVNIYKIFEKTQKWDMLFVLPK